MKKFIYIVVLLIILVFGFLGYMGYFSKYEVVEKETGPYTIAYKEFVGPYSKTGPIMDEVYQQLLKENIEPKLGVGIYLDNPAIVEAKNLRSEVGSIVEGNDRKILDYSEENYKIKTMDELNSVVVEFPYKNIFSFMLGPIKIYPVLESYLLKQGIEWTEDIASIEIYDLENKVISYIVNIETKPTIPQNILEVAQNNTDCSMTGILTDKINYNEITKTWWIDLERMPELKKDGCNPACVVNEETMAVEVNHRCTGALMTPPITE